MIKESPATGNESLTDAEMVQGFRRWLSSTKEKDIERRWMLRACTLAEKYLAASVASETPRNIHGRSSCEEMESMYHKVVMVAMECDPIPACEREDDRIEPPWEVFARMKRERDEARERTPSATRRISDDEARLLAEDPPSLR